MKKKNVQYGLIALTLLLGAALAYWIAGDYHDYQKGPRSEFSLEGLGALLLFFIGGVYFFLFFVAGLIVRKFSKEIGKSVHIACAVSFPIVVFLMIGALIIAEKREGASREKNRALRHQQNLEWQAKQNAEEIAVEAALSANPNDTQALIKRADRHYTYFRFNEAVHDLERVITLDPKNVLAHERIARSFTAMQRYDEAITHYEKAILLAPEKKKILMHSIEQCRDLKQGSH